MIIENHREEYHVAKKSRNFFYAPSSQWTARECLRWIYEENEGMYRSLRAEIQPGQLRVDGMERSASGSVKLTLRQELRGHNEGLRTKYDKEPSPRE